MAVGLLDPAKRASKMKRVVAHMTRKRDDLIDHQLTKATSARSSAVEALLAVDVLGSLLGAEAVSLALAGSLENAQELFDDSFRCRLVAVRYLSNPNMLASVLCEAVLRGQCVAALGSLLSQRVSEHRPAAVRFAAWVLRVLEWNGQVQPNVDYAGAGSDGSVEAMGDWHITQGYMDSKGFPPFEHGPYAAFPIEILMLQERRRSIGIKRLDGEHPLLELATSRLETRHIEVAPVGHRFLGTMLGKSEPDAQRIDDWMTSTPQSDGEVRG